MTRTLTCLHCGKIVPRSPRVINSKSIVLTKNAKRHV